MVRYGVILAFILQSFLLLWCAGSLPTAREGTGAAQSCAAQPPALEQECCCADEEDGASASKPDARNPRPAVATLPERCCECPLTVREPQVPAVPDRRKDVEPIKVSIALGSKFDLVLPARTKLSSTAVPASTSPPTFAGRLACERFCRWTI
jgi:hypothetical protein